MARKCADCSRVLRWDEHLTTLQFPDANGATATRQACPHCVARRTDTPAADPARYPVGQRVPRAHAGDGDMPICALCRRALFEDDGGEPMRILDEDLSEQFWKEYTFRMRATRQALDAEADAAEKAYEEACRPWAEWRDARLAEIHRRLAEQLNAALEKAPNEAAYQIEEALIRADHELEANTVNDRYEAATRTPRDERDATRFRAGVEYRKKSLEVMAGMPRLGVPDVEPGCYSSCRDCVRTYRPRIRERLIRQRVISADLPVEAMQGNLLL